MSWGGWLVSPGSQTDDDSVTDSVREFEVTRRMSALVGNTFHPVPPFEPSAPQVDPNPNPYSSPFPNPNPYSSPFPNPFPYPNPFPNPSPYPNPYSSPFPNPFPYPNPSPLLNQICLRYLMHIKYHIRLIILASGGPEPPFTLTLALISNLTLNRNLTPLDAVKAHYTTIQGSLYYHIRLNILPHKAHYTTI